MQTYIAFLRGINVGGHHKVPMADLRKEMGKMGFDHVVTVLNSGNIIFKGRRAKTSSVEKKIGKQLEKVFGFPIPTIVRTLDVIDDLLSNDPFEDITVTKDTRLYVSFLRNDRDTAVDLPWISDDGAFQVLEKRGQTIISVLDLSVSKTPKAMEILERWYSKKNITTRNWKTIKRIEKKL